MPSDIQDYNDDSAFSSVPNGRNTKSFVSLDSSKSNSKNLISEISLKKSYPANTLNGTIKGILKKNKSAKKLKCSNESRNTQIDKSKKKAPLSHYRDKSSLITMRKHVFKSTNPSSFLHTICNTPGKTSDCHFKRATKSQAFKALRKTQNSVKSRKRSQVRKVLRKEERNKGSDKKVGLRYKSEKHSKKSSVRGTREPTHRSRSRGHSKSNNSFLNSSIKVCLKAHKTTIRSGSKMKNHENARGKEKSQLKIKKLSLNPSLNSKTISKKQKTKGSEPQINLRLSISTKVIRNN